MAVMGRNACSCHFALLEGCSVEKTCEEQHLEDCENRNPEGIVQPFPNYFHEYYVIGFIENGERCLSCKNQEYTKKKGNILLFNPGDNHACMQSDNGSFPANVISDEKITRYLQILHEKVMNSAHYFEKKPVTFDLHAHSRIWAAVCETKKKVNKLTGSISLLR